ATHCFFFASRRRHTRFSRDWSSDVCSSDLLPTCLPLDVYPREWLRPYTPATSPCTPHVALEIVVVSVFRRGSSLLFNRCFASPRSEERRVGKVWSTRCRACHETQQRGAITW